MARKGITRQQPLTDEEAARYQRMREQIAAELPDIRRRAQAGKPRILLKHVLGNLRQERQRLGLSLADVNARSGIDRGTLSKLENEHRSQCDDEHAHSLCRGAGQSNPRPTRRPHGVMGKWWHSFHSAHPTINLTDPNHAPPPHR